MVFSMLRICVRTRAGIFEKATTTKMLKKKTTTAVADNNNNNMRQVCGCVGASSTFLDKFDGFNMTAARYYSKHTEPRTEKKYASDSESDSDLDVRGHRGESKFWRRKMRTFHGILDVNKDGVVSFEDFKLLADRFVQLGHMSEKNAREFYDLIRTLWEKQWGEVSPYNLVTVEQYLEDMNNVLNDKNRVRKVHSFLPYIFQAVDKDKSGEITVEEFKLFFECLGLKDEDAVFTFRCIDTDADGKITLKRFVKHGRDFFVAEDENSISKYFWGPLVEK